MQVDTRAFGGAGRFVVVLVTLVGIVAVAGASPPRASAQQGGAIAWQHATYTVVEGEELLIGVVRTGGTTDLVSAEWSTTDGPAETGAEAGIDFVDATQRIAPFQEGVAFTNVTLNTIEDGAIEADETLTITLHTPHGGATLGTLIIATVTILDDDGPSIFSFGAPTYTFGEADGVAAISVIRSGMGAAGDSVNLTVANGTAVQPGDYLGPGAGNALTVTVVFAAGEFMRDVNIPIVNDTANEPDETVTLTLSDPMGVGAGLGAPLAAPLTIEDDDGAGKLQFATATATVNEDVGIAVVMVERVGGTLGTVTADCGSVGGGSATPASDYVTLVPTTLTFADGVTNQPCSLIIIDNPPIESDETVNLALTNPTGGAVFGMPTTMVVTIDDNDTGDVLDFLHDGYEVVEESVAITITVVRTGSLIGQLTVTYATAEILGGATSGVDFLPTGTVLVFNDGEATKTFTVTLIEDTDAEDREGISLILSAPSTGASIGPLSPIVLDILDDDGDPPAVTGISTTQGPAAGGTSVVITGSHFVDVQSVKFGAVEATSFTVNSENMITAIAPEHDEGNVSITVTAPSGVSPSTALDTFTFLGAPPEIDSLDPQIGPASGGTVVTITGDNFTGATAVTFGGAAATNVTVVSDTVMTARSPARSPGTVNVRVTSPDGTSTVNGASDDFEYLETGETVTYTLNFRWVLIVWAGPDGASVEAALRGQGHADATDVFNSVSVLFTWNATLEAWLGFFTQAVTDNIPSANDFTTLEQGRAYWVATKVAGGAIWIVAGN